MNEELRIVIKAITDDAKKKIKTVNDELDKLRKDGKKGIEQLSGAFKGVGKAAAVATAAVAATTAAMAGLGQKALEVEKGISKLNTAFLSAGSTTEQAKNTYRELFGILGDSDRAVETAQSLSRITTEADKLAEYYDILAGSMAKYGDGLQAEAFSEQIAETIASGKAMGDLARVLVEAGISEDAFNAALEQTVSLEEREVLVRSTLNSILGTTGALYRANNQATIQYNQSQANLNLALASAAAYTTPLLTALNNLGTTLLSTFGPALRTVSLYLTAFIQLIIEAVKWIGGFFGLIGGKASEATSAVNGYTSAMGGYTNNLNKSMGASGKGIDSNIKKLKELKKQTMGFDELNVVSKPTDTSATGTGGGGGIGGGGFDMGAIPDLGSYDLGTIGIDMSQFNEDLEVVKEKLEGALVLVGLITAGFLAWKIATSGITLTSLMGALTTIAGQIAVVAGAMLLLKGYTDAWANGVDWGNIATMIGGIALAVGGLYVAVGPLAASIGLLTGGVALIVLGMKDFIETGPTVQNTALIIGGAIATAVALATMGIGPLIAAIIAAVAAVAAFTAAILLEKPAIMSVEEAQKKLTEAKEKAAQAENSYINAVDGAESALKRLQDAEKAAGMTGEELYAQVQNGNLTYEEMNSQQRELYKAYLDNEQKQKDLKAATEELTAAKKAETIASFENDLALAKESGSYDDFKKSVVEAYEQGKLSAEEARDLIEKSMSEMSDASQQTFMEDLPGDITEGMNPHRYESTLTKMGKWFSDKWESIVNAVGKYFTKEYWTEKFDGIKQGMKNALNGVIGFVEKAVNWIVKQLNKISIDIPDWVPVVGGKKFGFNLKEVKLQRLAKGGIVDSATYAMIGEAGKEAVVPLENNTEWMDKLAERLASQINTPSRLVLNVDGRELGWATINGINGITKQTGYLQLKMV